MDLGVIEGAGRFFFGSLASGRGVVKVRFTRLDPKIGGFRIGILGWVISGTVIGRVAGVVVVSGKLLGASDYFARAPTFSSLPAF